MNLSLILTILLFLQTDGKQPRSEMYRDMFGQKTSINWIFRESSVVLSGDISQSTANSVLLRNVEFYKGNLDYSDSLWLSWPVSLQSDLQIGDRALLFVDSIGSVLSDFGYGTHYTGCVEMKEFKIYPGGYFRRELISSEPYILTADLLELLKQGDCVNPEFVPVTASLHFPISGETLEFSIVRSGDSICTVSNYHVLDSCQVISSFCSPNGTVSFYASVKKNRNFNRTRITLGGGHDITYVNNKLYVNFISSHSRTLEEFLDYAATGHVQEYDVLIESEYDFSELGLDETLVLHKGFYGYLGLCISDSTSMNICSDPPENLSFEDGYICYKFASLDTPGNGNLLCFNFADSLPSSEFNICDFWRFVSQPDHSGEVFLFKPVDSLPVFLDTLACEVVPYDDNLSNKDSTALFRDSAYMNMYGSRKPTYFRTEPGDTLNLEINHSEGMMADTAFTYTWLRTNDGKIVHPIEIIEGYVENANYVRSKFTYIFTIPDSIRGKLFIDMRGRDRGGTPLWWGFGRSYWGIVDVIDSTDCHRDKR